jgi:hypothetical protein
MEWKRKRGERVKEEKKKNGRGLEKRSEIEKKREKKKGGEIK